MPSKLQTPRIVGLCALAGCAACGAGAKGPPARANGPVAHYTASVATRERVALTIYNSNFGLVRETRRVPLGRGRVELDYQDVAAHIQPETVHLESLSLPDGLAVLEQNYRYDLITPQKLLEKYVGKRLKVVRDNPRLGTEEVRDAEVLSSEQGPVLRIDGEITSAFPGRFLFPELPAELTAKPSLVWLLDSDRAEQRLELSYLTENLSWRADYVLSLDAADAHGDLTGWVTLSNTSGATFRDAELKLVAGDVQRVAPPPPPGPVPLASAPAPLAPPPPAFKQEGLFEYHLYSLQRHTDLRDQEQKQVTLLEAHGVALRKKLELRGHEELYQSVFREPELDQKVGVYVVLENREADGLGMPLPKGTLRVYKADSSGALQFLGEDSIDHTPRDEKIEVKLGDAFDVVADRKQLSWSALGSCSAESAWQVELRNHKAESQTVSVLEPVQGDVEVLSSSQPVLEKDAHGLRFESLVPANGTSRISYRVRNKWC